MKSRIALKILKRNISASLHQGLNRNLITQYTSQHQWRPPFQIGPPININILPRKFLNNLLPPIASTNGGKMDAVFALGSNHQSRIDWMFTVALEDLFYALEVALVAGLQELLLLFLFLGQVVRPDRL